MSATAAKAGVAGWRTYGLGSGLLATFVLIVGLSQPWFERVAPERYHYFSYTYSPRDNAHPSAMPNVPDEKLQLLAMVYQGQFSMLFFLLTAAGALIGFILAFWRPTNQGTARAVTGNVILAAASTLLTVLMWYSLIENGSPGWHTEARIGFLLAAPAQALWLVLAVLQARALGSARRAGVLTPPLPTT